MGHLGAAMDQWFTLIVPQFHHKTSLVNMKGRKSRVGRMISSLSFNTMKAGTIRANLQISLYSGFTTYI